MGKDVKAAQSRRAAWSPRGCLCPICKRSFQNHPACVHTVQQARDRLDEDVIRAVVREELRALARAEERSRVPASPAPAVQAEPSEPELLR